jgi:hypothetical protein
LPGGAEENCENNRSQNSLSPARHLNPRPHAYESGVLTSQLRCSMLYISGVSKLFDMRPHVTCLTGPVPGNSNIEILYN